MKCECCYCNARRGLSPIEADWIKTEDEKPPERLHILAVDVFDEDDPESYEVCTAYYNDGVWYSTLDGGPLDWDDVLHDKRRKKYSKITHWRYMPKPPAPFVPQTLILRDKKEKDPILSTQWNAHFNWPKQDAIRFLIKEGPYIGLDKAFSIRGKAIYIDEKQFFIWVQENPEYKKKIDTMFP